MAPKITYEFVIRLHTKFNPYVMLILHTDFDRI